jgi:hypothetical protein
MLCRSQHIRVSDKASDHVHSEAAAVSNNYLVRRSRSCP